jgi:hypothetical protein
MASSINKKSTLTLAQVTAWREELFDHRSLRTTVEALSEWPLSQYLRATVLQAAHLDRLRQTSTWDFGRLAKAHPLLFSLDKNLAPTRIKNTIGGRFSKDHLHMHPADAEIPFEDLSMRPPPPCTKTNNGKKRL